jgi:hypothetical protein
MTEKGPREIKMFSRPPELEVEAEETEQIDAIDDVFPNRNKLTADHDTAAGNTTVGRKAQHEDSRSLSKIFKHEHRKRFWYTLPKITKATLVLSFISSVMLIAYAIVTVSLRSEDEEAHVSTTIIILSLFQFLVTVDAVIYENPLQLIASIVLSFLMMLRVLWFMISRKSDTQYLPLKVVWGSLVCATILLYIACSLVSCRAFGWRLYSRLGVDFRRPGARKVMRVAFIANVFNTLLKFDFILLVVFCALGITISVEGRESMHVALFTLSVCTFFLDLCISILALLITASPRWKKKAYLFHSLMPLSFAGPIAIIAIYYSNGEDDVANAATSTLIAGCVFMVFRLALWWCFQRVANESHMVIVGGRATLRQDIAKTSSWNKYEAHLAQDQVLAPLFDGEWLRKPTPRDPKKLRFFQLSHDASTLRWGWKKFVRLYYVEDVVYSEENLSIRLTFLLDPELELVFPDQSKFQKWRKGIERLLILLLSPEANEEIDSQAGALISKKSRTSSTTLPSEPSFDEEKGVWLNALRKPFSSKRTSATLDSPSLEGVSSPDHPENKGKLDDRREPSSSVSKEQIKKRQRMASYLFPGVTRSPLAWVSSFKRNDTKKIPNPMSPGISRRILISVGTQTEPVDLNYLLEESSNASGQRHQTDDDKNADIAAQYAAMFQGMGTLEKPPLAPKSPAMTDTQRCMDADAASPSASLGLVEKLKEMGRNPGSLSPTSPGGSLMMDPTPTSSGLSGLMVSVEVVDFESITMGKLLGSGSEGDVHAAWYLESPVAVKRYNRLEDASYEAGMYLSTGNHDNIVSLRALCHHNENIYLIMEYCPRGTLDSMLHYTSRLIQWDPLKLLPIIRGICRGMYHLHSRGILHRDLKPGNVFIGHGSTMKIGDFGMSCIVAPGQNKTEEFLKTTPQEVFELVGTLQYTAPELVNPALRSSSSDLLETSKKVDVYSFGVTLWEIMERERPFEGMDALGIQSMWLNSPYTAHRLPQFPKLKLPADEGDEAKLRVYQSLSDLIDDCLKLSPEGRPTFKDILRRLKSIRQPDVE